MNSITSRTNRRAMLFRHKINNMLFSKMLYICRIWIIIIYLYFCSVFESIQTLFWTGFGEVDLETFDLPGMKPYTRFWALVIFATYSVINVTIMLNLLIAMMSNSYSVIEVHIPVYFRSLILINHTNVFDYTRTYLVLQIGTIRYRMEVFQGKALAELFRRNPHASLALQRVPHSETVQNDFQFHMEDEEK